MGVRQDSRRFWTTPYGLPCDIYLYMSRTCISAKMHFASLPSSRVGLKRHVVSMCGGLLAPCLVFDRRCAARHSLACVFT